MKLYRPMHLAAFVLLAILATQGAHSSVPAAAQAALECVSEDEMRSLIAGRHAVSSALAVRAARRAAKSPGAELLRTRLCREAGRLTYVVTFLRRDGRVVPTMVDAASGRVIVSK